jgi:hypothetical protein
MADSRKNQAEAEFRKTQRALDGKKAVSEYEAEANAVRANMQKLRALRLARDAADAAAAPAPAPAKKKAGKKAKPAAAPLAAWLKDREDSGRNS